MSENMQQFDEELNVITMLDEEGQEHDFFIVDAVNLDGANYILIVDAEADEEDPEGIPSLILKETGAEGEDVLYDVIEDEEEFNKVLELFEANEDFEIE